MSKAVPEERNLSVYIHIPFCRRKCAYCDFVSFAGTESLIPDYMHAVQSELRAWAPRFPGWTVRTVYFGGGTPSLLPPDAVASVLSGLRADFSVDPGAEISLEANPESVTGQKAERWLEAGVNRLSLGVQSFRDAELGLLGRIHDSDTARTAFSLLREAGFKNLSLDLMYGLPGQSPENWRESLAVMQQLAPQHLSCYQLILEEGTELTARVSGGELPPAAEEEELLRMDEDTREAAAACGLLQYEVSNYALPGCECRHNLNYWECGTYLGLGCAAHGDCGGRRIFNTQSLPEYISGKASGRGIPEDGNDLKGRRFERMMMGLRMLRGVDLSRFKRDFGGLPGEFWPQSLAFMRENGFLIESKERIALSGTGMPVMNALLVRMLEEQEESALKVFSDTGSKSDEIRVFNH